MSLLNAWLSIFLILGITILPLSMPIPVRANQPPQKSAIDHLKDIFRPTRRQGGTRGGGCLVMPGDTLWSDRPLFVWNGPVTKLEVRTETDHRLVWSQMLAQGRQSALYQGEPLQPGQTYEVILYDANGDRLIRNEQFYPRFTLTEASQRQQIQADLTQRAQQLQTNQARVEAIAIEQAIYFAERELWSDALQVISSVPAPSAELSQFLQVTLQNTCKAPDAALIS